MDSMTTVLGVDVRLGQDRTGKPIYVARKALISYIYGFAYTLLQC